MMHAKAATSTQERASATWAEAFAQRLQHAHVAPAPAPLVGEAVQALWALFDTAVAQANAALLAAGEEVRIAVEADGPERQYWAAGPDGRSRVISVFLTLPAAGGQLCGGAFISSNRSRLAMYLVPDWAGGQVCWRLPESGRAFTADHVHDLFLSVFADDPAATRRLSPLSGCELFQSPWV